MNVTSDDVGEVAQQADSLDRDEKIMAAAVEKEIRAKIDGDGADDIQDKDHRDEQPDVEELVRSDHGIKPRADWPGTEEVIGSWAAVKALPAPP